MGCFSFICAECGEPINSTSFDGEYVHLFLLEDGFPREHMYGKYDSYGRVFKDDGCSESLQWKLDWDGVCDLMFNDNPRSGIAVVHGKCFNGGENVPHMKSEDDPEQGWGDLKYDCLESDIDPFHEVLHVEPEEIEPHWYDNSE